MHPDKAIPGKFLTPGQGVVQNKAEKYLSYTGNNQNDKDYHTYITYAFINYI